MFGAESCKSLQSSRSIPSFWAEFIEKSRMNTSAPAQVEYESATSANNHVLQAGRAAFITRIDHSGCVLRRYDDK